MNQTKRTRSPKITKLLGLMSEAHGIIRSSESAEMLVDDLSRYSESEVIEALQRCRFELPRFPTLAEIVTRLPDGRPGIEEAWAMCPKVEESSVVWTDEMSDAFSVARPLLIQGDEIAARMAFRESYSKLLVEARARGKKTNWSPSLGSDHSDRSRALIDAIEKKRISSERAISLEPQINLPAHLDPLGITQDSARLLSGPPSDGLTQFDPVAMVREIKKQIEGKEGETSET